MSDQILGELLIIGGAEDKTGDCTILRWFVEKTKNERGKIAVISTAASAPEEVGIEYREIFQSLGSHEVEVLTIQNRIDAYHRGIARVLEDCAGIYFTGGDQLRITSVLGGTPVASALYRAYQKGAIIAGTSAGAAIMSETMIVEGEDDESPRRCTVKMAPGLGLMKQVVVDMHFSQRGRQGRLLAAIGQNPNSLGIGIDEDTAVIVKDGKIEIIGSRTVWLVDGRQITYSNVSELAPDEVLVLSDVRLHVLPEGYGFDLNRRLVLTTATDRNSESTGNAESSRNAGSLRGKGGEGGKHSETAQHI